MAETNAAEEQDYKKCMYCWQFKPAIEMTLEHAIPQCLGGSQAPSRFKVRAACRTCNNALGLYVDARFEKSAITTYALAEATRSLAETDPSVIPVLHCVGSLELSTPEMLESEVCEWWMGPQGEHAFLIRPQAEDDFEGYLGGNPIVLKQIAANARVYFFFTASGDHNRSLTLFKNAFKRKKVRKVLGTEVSGIDILQLGFSAPNEGDQAAIEYFWKVAFGPAGVRGRVPFSNDFDTRFMCKLALAVGYCELGESYLESDYAKCLHRGLWYRGEGELPDTLGARPFNSPQDKELAMFSCDPGAVSLLTVLTDGHLFAVLNIHQKHTWRMVVAKQSELPNLDFERFSEGKLVMLFGPANRSYEAGFPDYLAKRLATFGPC